MLRSQRIDLQMLWPAWWWILAVSAARAFAFRSPARVRLRRPSSLRAAAPALSAEVESALATCRSAAETKSEDGDTVVSALLALEKGMREASKADAGVSAATYANLDGCWRLIFTTGTIDTQKKIGQINYFPLKAVQTFDTERGRISTSPAS